MRFTKSAGAALALVLSTASAIAAGPAAKSNPLADCLTVQGWHGTLGGTEVTFWFESDERALRGRYFYRNSFNELTLTPVAGVPGAMIETDIAGNETGYLTLACTGAQLSGVWTKSRGGKPVLISAARIKDYDEHRLASLIPRPGAVVTKGGVRFEALTVPGLPSYEGKTAVQWGRFLDAGPGGEKINTELAKDAKQTAADHLWCLFQGRAFDRLVTGEFSKVTLESVKYPFVELRHDFESDCGQATAPPQGSDVMLYNLETGDLELATTWLGLGDRFDPAPLPAALLRIIRRRYEALAPMSLEPECAADAEIDFWAGGGWVTLTGMGFSPNVRANSACNAEVMLPFKDIKPFLSDYGKSRLVELETAAKHGRQP